MLSQAFRQHRLERHHHSSHCSCVCKMASSASPMTPEVVAEHEFLGKITETRAKYIVEIPKEDMTIEVRKPPTVGDVIKLSQQLGSYRGDHYPNASSYRKAIAVQIGRIQRDLGLGVAVQENDKKDTKKKKPAFIFGQRAYWSDAAQELLVGWLSDARQLAIAGIPALLQITDAPAQASEEAAVADSSDDSSSDSDSSSDEDEEENQSNDDAAAGTPPREDPADSGGPPDPATEQLLADNQKLRRDNAALIAKVSDLESTVAVLEIENRKLEEDKDELQDALNDLRMEYGALTKKWVALRKMQTENSSPPKKMQAENSSPPKKMQAESSSPSKKQRVEFV